MDGCTIKQKKQRTAADSLQVGFWTEKTAGFVGLELRSSSQPKIYSRSSLSSTWSLKPEVCARLPSSSEKRTKDESLRIF